ncbi:ABC transporter permease, partial [Acidovorax sp.]|uniref:ABC transporter permease n=1 Tax=Acidovorax sp. TaxID=1872122 RepID=UPI0025C37CE3
MKPMPAVSPPHQGLLQAWLQALATVVRDKGVLLLLVGAPVLYGFFYPWFYADEVLTRVPVAGVDRDHTSLSRQITRFADADPRIEVRFVAASEREAQEALWRGEIEGYAVIPAGLKRSVVRGENA